MEYSIKLVFLTADGQKINVNVPGANPAVTGQAVIAAMNRILNTHIIVTKAGEPIAVDKAELISTEETVYVL
ncbi:MAG: DUF2922 domain-containing protein [Clostridiales bacterium]|jgi:hypothetical protein|nr:DUF2922 domain-containing protein [Clostridiales bacterium]